MKEGRNEGSKERRNEAKQTNDERTIIMHAKGEKCYHYQAALPAALPAAAVVGGAKPTTGAAAAAAAAVAAALGCSTKNSRIREAQINRDRIMLSTTAQDKRRNKQTNNNKQTKA